MVHIIMNYKNTITSRQVVAGPGTGLQRRLQHHHLPATDLLQQPVLLNSKIQPQNFQSLLLKNSHNRGRDLRARWNQNRIMAKKVIKDERDLE